MLQQINLMAKYFVREDYLQLAWYAEADAGGKWTNKISVIASRTEKLLKFPIISKIGAIKELNLKFISSASKCRQHEYTRLAEISETYMRAKHWPLDYLKCESQGKILEPLNKDSLYEIAVLFKAMETAIKCGWLETKAGVIGGVSRTASKLIKCDTEIRFYTQHIPTEFKKASAYGQLMTDYGLSENLRRPDIIVEIIKQDAKHFLIIEVKRSRKRDYLAEGTYKLLGYLKDFEKVRQRSKLTGFLVGWNGINPSAYQIGNEVGLFNWDDFCEGFTAYLTSI
jgi:hypothetical protein